MQELELKMSGIKAFLLFCVISDQPVVAFNFDITILKYFLLFLATMDFEEAIFKMKQKGTVKTFEEIEYKPEWIEKAGRKHSELKGYAISK